MEKGDVIIPETRRDRHVNINFIYDPNYETAGNQYKKIFNEKGSNIIDALQKHSGLEFLEEQITAIVGGFERSFSGKRLEDPMNLRATSSMKEATLMHELTHRLLMQHPGLWSAIRKQFHLKDVHQVVNLILYPAMVEVLGEEEADRRVESERRSKYPQYKKYWDWYINPENEEVRKKILEFIHQWKEQNTEERIK